MMTFGSACRICRAASMPFRIGILTSSTTMSGRNCAAASMSGAAVLRGADDVVARRQAACECRSA